MANLDSILKSREITLSTKVHLVKAMVFPVVMFGCESWTVKKAEHQRIDASELWCWRRFLRAPWTARRSNQPILKEISPGCSLEGLMLMLKLQYFGHLMRRADSFEKTLMFYQQTGIPNKKYFFFKKIFIFIYLFDCTGSSFAAYGIQFTGQGLNPGPLHWQLRALVTGPPRKSLFLILDFILFLAPCYVHHCPIHQTSLPQQCPANICSGRRKRGNRGRDGWMTSPTQWT